MARSRQIADGTVQTSGVSVSVRGQGGASGAGGGTIAYDNGIVEYTPTQAETNFTSFIVVAYKTGCIPACVTVVTTASGTPGNAGLDWGAIINKTATNALTNTTISTTWASFTVTGATTLTGAVSMAGGLSITQSTGNGNGITVTGNGTGAGISVTGGSAGGDAAGLE